MGTYSQEPHARLKPQVSALEYQGVNYYKVVEFVVQ